jgi:type II secretory pathway pseudopilin PulG
MTRRCDFRTGSPCRWGRDGRALRLRHPAADEGFTIIESVVALGIIFLVLTGLLGTLGSATKGIVTARQRNTAVGLANQVLETARASSYATVGLNSADTTLATDSAIVSGAYDPDGTGSGAAEPLAYASPSSASPWPLHKFPTTVSGTVYQTYVYVTTVTPTGADPYKRVTALVDWSGSGRTQYAGTAIASSLKLSSFVYNASLPADPLLEAIASATGGTISISGTVDNLVVADATLALPQASSSLSSQFIQEADALAESAGTDLDGDLSLYASGANASLVTSTHASSPPVKVASAADNDAGTSAAENSSATSSDAGGSIGRTNTLDLVKGASSSLYAKSTARSTTAGAIGDNDLLPYSTSDSAGPASFTMPYNVSSLTGGSTIGNVITTGATHVNTVLDRDTAGTQKQLLGTASVDHPATTLFTFAPTVLNILGLTLANPFTGFVKIGATGTITATANSGQGVAAPAISGGAFDVCVYDTLSNPLGSGTCPAGYKRLTVTPGTAASMTAAAAVRVLGANVSLSATVTSGTKAVTSTLDGADYERADTRLANWLRIVVDLNISTGTNLHVEVDYGQLATRARYCLPTDAACIQAAL